MRIRIRDLESFFDPGSAMGKFGSGIRYNNLGSATLLLKCRSSQTWVFSMLIRTLPAKVYSNLFFWIWQHYAELNGPRSTTLDFYNLLFFRYDLYSAYDYVLPARGKVLAKTDIQVSIFSLLKNIGTVTRAEYLFGRYLQHTRTYTVVLGSICYPQMPH
jgi:hypothetical protein